MWVVYLIQSLKDNSIYTGISNNLEKRLLQHNQGKGSRYTRSRKPFILLGYIECDSKSQALKLEYKIKQMTRQQKLLFLKG